MQKTRTFAIRFRRSSVQGAFTLMETVIAIGVLAVLLTGFVAVFTPAAQGIRRSISSQQADRLTSTLERELVTLRTGQEPTAAKTGFDKGFTWLKEGNDGSKAIFVYQYRGDPASSRSDGTPTPLPNVSGEPGKDYLVQSMARRADDSEFQEDLAALDGAIFFVKTTQLVFSADKLIASTQPGQITYAENGGQVVAADSNAYKDAVIAFSAEFHSVPTKAFSYLTGAAFKTRFEKAKNPIFTRNLAIRR